MYLPGPGYFETWLCVNFLIKFNYHFALYFPISIIIPFTSRHQYTEQIIQVPGGIWVVRMLLKIIFIPLYFWETLCVCVCVCVYVCLVVSTSVTPWTVACQAPLPVKFPRQEYWSGLTFPTLGCSSWPRDQTPISCVSCIGKWILHPSHYLGSPCCCCC